MTDVILNIETNGYLDICTQSSNYGDYNMAQKKDSLATGRFGDGGCKCFIRKKYLFKILQWLDYKGCLLEKCFFCHPGGQCGSSFARSLESLVDRDHV